MRFLTDSKKIFYISKYLTKIFIPLIAASPKANKHNTFQHLEQGIRALYCLCVVASHETRLHAQRGKLRFVDQRCPTNWKTELVR